ncbi:MAG: peptide ABC transporter substrate-binding protein [Pseudomonadota bacterium]
MRRAHWLGGLMVAWAGAICAPQAAADPSDQAISRGILGEPISINPQTAFDEAGKAVVYDLFEGLVSFSANGDLVPGAADGWTVSDDALIYTFSLDPGAKWSNGDPVTAMDFVESWRQLLSPETAAPYASLGFSIRNARQVAQGVKPASELGVTAAGDQTLIVELETATPFFLQQVSHYAFMPLHSSAIGTAPAQWLVPGELVSNGAYTLSQWRRGQRLSLARNPYYRAAGSVSMPTIHHVVSNDLSMEVLRYRAGEIEVSYDTPSTQISWLEERLPGELGIAPKLAVYYLAINLDAPALQNPGVRRALTMSIERDVLTEKITRGGEQPLYGLVPPSMWPEGQAYAPEWSSWPRPRRVAEARALMEAAGFDEDNRLRLEILFSDSDLAKRLFVATSAMWQDVHVDARLLNVEPRATQQLRRERQFQLFRTGWTADYAHPYTFLEIYRSDAGDLNFPNYRNARFDALLDEALAAQGEDAADLFRQAEALAMSDNPAIPIFVYSTRRLVKPYIGGWVKNPIDVNLSRHLYFEPVGGTD